MTLPIIPETHQLGILSIENLDLVQEMTKDLLVDVGIQTHDDGRIWICVNGVAFLRFKHWVTDVPSDEGSPIC